MGPPQRSNLGIERVKPFQRQPEMLLVLFILLNPMAMATVIVGVVVAVAAVVVVVAN